MASLHCKYCDSYLTDKDKTCPCCGAVNDNYKNPSSSNNPQTIAELQQWYIDRNLPPEETTRFFIGKNIQEPRAFGIYEENGKFIVYKNKANGQRAIRYEGRDEAYAVNELYLRLKEEILNQKRLSSTRKQKTVPNKWRKDRIKNKIADFISRCFIIGLFAYFALFMIVSCVDFLTRPKTGYYDYGTTLYYYLYDSHSPNDTASNTGWYVYDKDSDSWSEASYYDYEEFSDNHRDYYIGTQISGSSYDWCSTDFSQTSWYESYEYHEENYEDWESDSDDDDWDWDSGDSWDSGGSDWDSDW